MSEKRRFRVTIEGTVVPTMRPDDVVVPEVGMHVILRFFRPGDQWGQSQMVSGDTRIVAVEELPPPLSDKERADRAEKVLRKLCADFIWNPHVAGHIGRRAKLAGIDLSEPPG